MDIDRRGMCCRLFGKVARWPLVCTVSLPQLFSPYLPVRVRHQHHLGFLRILAQAEWTKMPVIFASMPIVSLSISLV